MIFEITDYDGAISILKNMKGDMKDIVTTYYILKQIPEKVAPDWTGDVKDNFVSIMDAYGKEARQLDEKAEILLNAALEYCIGNRDADDDIEKKLKQTT